MVQIDGSVKSAPRVVECSCKLSITSLTTVQKLGTLLHHLAVPSRAAGAAAGSRPESDRTASHAWVGSCLSAARPQRPLCRLVARKPPFRFRPKSGHCTCPDRRCDLGQRVGRGTSGA